MLLVTLSFLPTHTQSIVSELRGEREGDGGTAKDMEELANRMKQQEEEMVRVGQHLAEIKNILFAMHRGKHCKCRLSSYWSDLTFISHSSPLQFKTLQIQPIRSSAPLTSPPNHRLRLVTHNRNSPFGQN